MPMSGGARFGGVLLEGYGGGERNREGLFSSLHSVEAMDVDYEVGGRSAGFRHAQWLSDSLLPPSWHFHSGCHQPTTTYNNAWLGLPSGNVNIQNSAPTTFSSATHSWRAEPINSSYACIGLPSGNVSTQYSAPNLKIEANVSQDPSIVNNVYHESVLQCNSGFVPKVPQHPPFPVSIGDSWTNALSNDHHEAEKTDNQEGYMSNFQLEYTALPTNQLSSQPVFSSSFEAGDDEFHETELRLIIQKELTNSDVGRVGRIVLPKKEAEANLPALIERDTIMLHMNDLTLEVPWEFRYRFWPNNKSRMYIMETTGDFVRAHHLQKGDLFIIYQNTTSGGYIVEGKKTTQPESVDLLGCNIRNRSTENEEWYTQLPRSGNEGGAGPQLLSEQSQCLGDFSDSSKTMSGINFSEEEVPAKYENDDDSLSEFSFSFPEVELEKISLELEAFLS